MLPGQFLPKNHDGSVLYNKSKKESKEGDVIYESERTVARYFW